MKTFKFEFVKLSLIWRCTNGPHSIQLSSFLQSSLPNGKIDWKEERVELDAAIEELLIPLPFFELNWKENEKKKANGIGWLGLIGWFIEWWVMGGWPPNAPRKGSKHQLNQPTSQWMECFLLLLERLLIGWGMKWIKQANKAERRESMEWRGRPPKGQRNESICWRMKQLMNGAATAAEGKHKFLLLFSSSLCENKQQSIKWSKAGIHLIGFVGFLWEKRVVGYGWGPSPLPRANSASFSLRIPLHLSCPTELKWREEKIRERLMEERRDWFVDESWAAPAPNPFTPQYKLMESI